ncbi:hypothetical protein, partial [Frankia sp. CiP3]|uniref:hypothetical protein n=1 Tax=Frankia sp. CiP3 TaxID=2880971 RepID=UPI001EF5B5F8
MNRCQPEVLDNFVEPDTVRAYDALWRPGASPVLCVSGLSGSGKSTLLCYLHDRHDPHRVRVMLDLDGVRLTEGHRWLDALGEELSRQVRAVDLSRYRHTAARLDQQRVQIAPAAVHVRQSQSSLLGGGIEESPQTVHVDLSGAVAEANERKASHDRQARATLGDALFNALEPLAGREWVLLVDTYERVAHHANTEFRAWFEDEFLDVLIHRQPQARVVIAGREGLPTGGYLTQARPLAEWDRSASDRFLAGWGLADPALQEAVYAHCQGHPLVTDMARQVWQAGQDAHRPLRVSDLRPQTNRAAAIEWLLDEFVKRLPEDLRDAVRAATLLRDVSLEVLNAMLAPLRLDPRAFVRLLSLSFIGRPPVPARAHDLVREVEDSWRRREELTEYRRLHTAAFTHFHDRGDLVNSLYHLLVLDEDHARTVWVEAIDKNRLQLNLDKQSELLSLLQMPERQEWLQPHTRAFHWLFSGFLAVYQDRLSVALAAFERAATDFRMAGDNQGAATAVWALGDLY